MLDRRLVDKLDLVLSHLRHRVAAPGTHARPIVNTRRTEEAGFCLQDFRGGVPQSQNSRVIPT